MISLTAGSLTLSAISDPPRTLNEILIAPARDRAGGGNRIVMLQQFKIAKKLPVLLFHQWQVRKKRGDRVDEEM
jgi:hypothetical protein